MTFIADKAFDKINYGTEHFIKGEYDNCIFKQCDFSNADLSYTIFADCEFIECNLSLVVLTKTAFRDTQFQGCKMLGLRFMDCDEFGLLFSFDNCQLNNSSFYNTNIKKTVFRNSQLQDTDFASCDLTGATFDNCDLSNSIFDNTNIEKADFRTSLNFNIDPDINKLKKAKFSISGIPGLLSKYDIEIENSF